MPDTDEQTAAQKLKSASRDLMPIIAVCVSAIVLTLVAVTVYKLMTAPAQEAVELKPSLLDKRYLDFFSRGERYLQEGNLEAAEKEYISARDLALKEEASTILLAELELRLAQIMLEQHRPERASKHMQQALSYLKTTESALSLQLQEVQKILVEQEAEKRKNDTGRDVVQ